MKKTLRMSQVTSATGRRPKHLSPFTTQEALRPMSIKLTRRRQRIALVSREYPNVWQRDSVREIEGCRFESGLAHFAMFQGEESVS